MDLLAASRLVAPSSVVIVFGSTTLVYVAGKTLPLVVTLTVTLHVPGTATVPGGMIPPVSVTADGTVVEAAVPPLQVVAAVSGATGTKPVGRVSVNDTIFKGLLVLFCRVMVTVVVPPC